MQENQVSSCFELMAGLELLKDHWVGASDLQISKISG